MTAASSRGQSNPGSLDLSALDSILQSAVEHDEIPGAVLLVEHRGKVVYEKAVGMRALMPSREAMTTDTIFDIASLTKVVATAPSVMKLVEEGKLRLDDPVSRYLPDFTSNGKDQITIRMLLTHTGGLAPDPPLDCGSRPENLRLSRKSIRKNWMLLLVCGSSTAILAS